MRLLHVHSGNLYGGVETILTTLARFSANRLEHHFALCFDGRVAQELRRLEANVVQLGAARTRHPLALLRARRRLRRVLDDDDFDAVACHMPWAQAIFGPVVRRAGIASIFWMHDTSSGGHWLERWARRTPPDLAICNSVFTAASLPRLYPNVPGEVWYPPVTPCACSGGENRRAVRAELATPADAVVILQASRFEAWKGHREHLAALASLRHDPRWFCWLAGGGDTAKYEAELRDMAAQLGIVSRIRFCGFRRDVRRLMAAADIYCQPNTAPEPFGLAFAEALSAGLPVVTTAMGGVVELVDSSCGVLLPGSDPAALASALRRLIDDAALRSVLGRNGRARVLRLCNVDDQMARIDGIVGRLGRDYRAAGS